MMEGFAARCVFFVRDAERALRFYTETLGFSQEWTYLEEGRVFVFQVSLFGFQLIVNQTHPPIANRAGHGRVFIGIDDEQSAHLLKHIEKHGISASVVYWGAPTLAIHDLDENEIFVWLSETERAKLRPEEES